MVEEKKIRELVGHAFRLGDRPRSQVSADPTKISSTPHSTLTRPIVNDGSFSLLTKPIYMLVISLTLMRCPSVGSMAAAMKV